MRRIADPYDPSTWNGRGSGELPGPAEQGVGAPVRGEGPPDAMRGPHGPSSAALARSGSPETADLPPQADAEAEAADADPVDPPELPRARDPFELARRTVNRSRAAALDQGLYPISAKAQSRARDLRDRSTGAPGYSGARPDPRDPQGISAVLARVLGDLGWSAGMNAGRVLEEWDEIVGEQVAAHARPVSLEDGTLVVTASSSAWASQLRMLAPHLITTIEQHIGAHVITELKVTGPAAAQRTWKRGRRTVTWRGPRDTYG